MQYFLNMEIERYTLATGETAVAGFVRFWKPWGVLFCLFTILPNMWPGWATSGVTILTFLIGGGNVPLITIGVLVAAGIALTASPVVYQTLERAQFFKVGLTLVFLAVAIVAAISAVGVGRAAVDGHAVRPAARTRTSSRSRSILSGLVFAGAGGVNNLAQSNWIRDKGFGMGVYIPRIVSPITGEEVGGAGDRLDGAAGRGEPAALPRLVGRRQQGAARLVLVHLHLLDHRLLDAGLLHASSARTSAGQANLAFIQAEGEALKTIVAPWFGTFFWVFGALSMMLVALGVIDYISRIVADVLKTVYLQHSQRWTESRIYFLVVWSTIAAGLGHPAVRLQPAAAAAGHRRLPQRHGDVRLLDPAHPAQSPRAAAGAPRARPAAGHAGVRDAVLRLLRGLAGHRAGAGYLAGA